MNLTKPNNWEIVKLGDAATFINGYAFKPSDWSTEGLEIIRIQNLTKGSSDTNYFNGEIKDRYKVKSGDLLISWSATLGIYLWEGEDAWLNQHLFKVVFDKKKFDRQFFKYLIDTSLHAMGRETHGSTMKHITKVKFDRFKIPYPPLPEQQKIASVLDAANNLRQKDQQLIEKYTALSQSLFLDMFGDPVINPMGWEEKSLGDLCEQITDGTHRSPGLVETGIPYVTAKHVKSYGLDFLAKPTYIAENDHQVIYKRCSPEYGDVLYIKDGATTGLACINTFHDEISLLSSLALLKLKPELLSNHFLCFWLNHRGVKEKLIGQFMSGAAIKRYTLSKINTFSVHTPPIILQNLFAERIQAIEAQKQQAQASLQKSEDLFNSLLQHAFKGELTH